MEAAMKKTIIFSLMIGLVFFLGSCNDPVGGPDNPNGGGGATDVTWSWVYDGEGSRNNVGNSDNYPGVMLPLSGANTVEGTLGNITSYDRVILDAVLYADGTTETPVTQADGLAWFKLLAGTDWNSPVSTQVDNMLTNGKKEGAFSATVTPINILVQTPSASGVGSVEIRTLTLKVRTDLPKFDVVYGGDYVSTSDNTITFTGATYSNHAAIYTFPDTFPSLSNLAGKKLVFNYTAVDTTDTDDTKEYQIHIQAANGLNDYNGLPYGATNGQFYVTLDKPEEQFDQTYNEATKTGTFKIEFDKLIASAEDTTSHNDNTGRFDLTAVRILNNGDTYQSHIRKTAYSVTFNSIKVE
jgi:hypothetical protein